MNGVNVDEILRRIVIERAQKQGGLSSVLSEEIEWELSCIRDHGDAFFYVMLFEALKEVCASGEEYWFAGSLTSALVPFLLGFSKNDPYDENAPRVYPEMCYGISGRTKRPWMDLRASKDLYKRLYTYFTNCNERHERSGEGIHIVDHEDSFSIYLFAEFDQENKEEQLEKRHVNIIPVDNSSLTIEEIADSEIIRLFKPETFEDHVKCYGLSHSAGVWEENMKELLSDGVIERQDVLANREDVYEVLLQHGVDRRESYIITDDVRMGRINRKGWSKHILDELKTKGVPDWFFDSCIKIRYLWPRSHAMSFIKFRCSEYVSRLSADKTGLKGGSC